MKIFVLLLMLCLAVWLSGCKKEASPLPSKIPTITLESVTPTRVKAMADSILFRIKYEDGDGDLGDSSPDAKNLFIIDNRLNITHGFRVPALAPPGAVIPIRGRVQAVLDKTIFEGNNSSQTLTFSIYMTDRAGNRSNTITTPPLLLVP